MPAANLLPAVISLQIKEFRPSQNTLRVCSPHCLPIIVAMQCISRGGAMSPALVFIRKRKKCHSVLRRRSGFGPLDSMRYGLWLEKADREVAS